MVPGGITRPSAAARIAAHLDGPSLCRSLVLQKHAENRQDHNQGADDHHEDKLVLAVLHMLRMLSVALGRVLVWSDTSHLFTLDALVAQASDRNGCSDESCGQLVEEWALILRVSRELQDHPQSQEQRADETKEAALVVLAGAGCDDERKTHARQARRPERAQRRRPQPRRRFPSHCVDVLELFQSRHAGWVSTRATLGLGGWPEHVTAQPRLSGPRRQQQQQQTPRSSRSDAGAEAHWPQHGA